MVGKASLGFDPDVLCVADLDVRFIDCDSSLLLRFLEHLCLTALLLRRTLDLSELSDELDGDLCLRRRSLSLLLALFISASLEIEDGGAICTYLRCAGMLAICLLCFSVSMCTNSEPLSLFEGPQNCFLHTVHQNSCARRIGGVSELSIHACSLSSHVLVVT